MIQKRFDNLSAKNLDRPTSTLGTRYRENGGILDDQRNVISAMILRIISIIIIIIIIRAQRVWERWHLCMGLILHMSSPTQLCNSAISGTSHPLLCTQDRPCVVNDYTRQEVGLFKRNMADP